jgi:hypothetical protein
MTKVRRESAYQGCAMTLVKRRENGVRSLSRDHPGTRRGG